MQGSAVKILNQLNEEKLGRDLGVKPRSMRLVRERKIFPASWFEVVSRHCAAQKIECPLCVFNFKSADLKGESEAV